MSDSLYDAPITRKNPALIVFLLDMSGSMNEKVVYEGVTMSKSEALNSIVNKTIQEMLYRCRKFSGYYNYFDFVALGYSEDDTIQLFEEVVGKSSTSDEFYSVKDLAESQVENITRQRRSTDETGNVRYSLHKVPQYIRPHSYGKTPMYLALSKTYDLTKTWIEAHSGTICFPPIIINITDGEATDAAYPELLAISDKIRSLKTCNGSVLLLNIHIGNSSDTKDSVRFPKCHTDLPCVKYAKDLFEMSSILPESMCPALKGILSAKDVEDIRGSRMMTFNSSMVTILEAINIGTVSIINHI